MQPQPLIPTTTESPAPTEPPATSIAPIVPDEPDRPIGYSCGADLQRAVVDGLLAQLTWYDGETALGGPYPMSLRTADALPRLDVCPPASGAGVSIPVAGHDVDEIGSAVRALIGARADADPGLPPPNSSAIWPSRGPVELDGADWHLMVVPDDHAAGGHDPARLAVWPQPQPLCAAAGALVPCSTAERTLSDCHDWWPWCP